MPAKKPRPATAALDPDSLRRLLERHRAGTASTDDVLADLRRLPFADLGFARVDTHRHLRRGFPEVVFGAGKTRAQTVAIVDELMAHGGPVLVTRTTKDVFDAVRRRHRAARWVEAARIVSIVKGKPVPTGKGTVLVVCAGTADVPVAEEAATTSEVMGNRTERVFDAGVAGIHRLLVEEARLAAARVVVVVAGMEGALPSVVGGLVSVPVVAVPTSTGYGASFGGLAPLLGMLNSCASGVVVVNIDNGFGAAYAASLINHLG